MDAANTPAHGELMMLFEALQDICTFQERQMFVTNLTALVYAGLIGFASVIPKSDDWRGWVLGSLEIAATLTAFGSIWWLWSLQSAMQRARGKVERLRLAFTNEFHAAHREPLPSGFGERMDTFPFLVIVVVVGLVLAGISFNAVMK
jgi:hypothetical protein